MFHLPTIAALLLYAWVAFVHLLPTVIPPRAQRHTRTVAAVGALLNGVGLALSPYAGVTQPGFHEALSAAALGFMASYVIVGRAQLSVLGLLLAPLSVVVLGLAQFVPHRSVAAVAAAGTSPWLPVHLGLMVAGLGGFALSSSVGALYLYVRNRLKQKRIAGLARLPSLEVLDRMQFRAMLFGFTFLTLGIAVGGALASARLTGQWTFDPKVAFTATIWLWYAVALQVRLVAGWRGRLSALFSIVGFAGMIFSLVGLNFLIGGFHALG